MESILKPFPERYWLSLLLLILPYHHYRPALAWNGKSELTLPDVIVTLWASQLSFISDPDGLVLPDEAQPFDSWPRVIQFRAKVGPVDTTLWRLFERSSWGGSRLFLCQMENEVCVRPREAQHGGAAYTVLPFSSKFIFSLSCCVYILYYLPLTTNISKAHVLCLLALNSSAMTETLYFLCLLGWNLLLGGKKTVIAFWVISPPLILFTFREGFW